MSKIELSRNKAKFSSWLIGGMGIAFFLLISAILLLYPFASNDKKAYFHGSNPILFNGRQEGNAIIEGNTLYVPLTFLQKEIDNSILYDKKSNSVIITTKNKVIQMPTESLIYFVNLHPVKLEVTPVKTIQNHQYVALEPLLSYYPIQFQTLNGTNAIWIKKNGEKYRTAIIYYTQKVQKTVLRLRISPSFQSPYTAETKRGEVVRVEGKKNGFYFIRKENGIGGFLKKEYVKAGKEVAINIITKNQRIYTPKINGPVQLTWEAVYTKNPDSKKIPLLSGVNVVSPTWFSIQSINGNIKSLASLEYTKWAKSRGYQVWGHFSNSFDPSLTHEVLKDYETRQKMIAQLLQYSKMYQLQGINFDIENVNPEDGPLVTQFLREAVPLLHEEGLVVSMDITFLAQNSNWSTFYERKKLAQIVDFLIIMAYDEHSGSSSDIGSVASLPWVETNLKKLLQEVPSHKLILGVPLYTRLWKEQVLADGTKDISSKALTMSQEKAWLIENKVTPVYDPKNEQNYAEYFDSKENATYKIWLEDDLSLKKRSSLYTKYHLAGIASWARFFADPTAWTALNLNPDKAFAKK